MSIEDAVRRSDAPRDHARYPRCLRMADASAFKRVFAQAQRSGGRAFTVLARENGLAAPRLGLVIPKKKARKAVLRNRLKRVVRESFRRRKAQIPAFDVVVLLKQGGGELDNPALFAELERHWRRLGEMSRSLPTPSNKDLT